MRGLTRCVWMLSTALACGDDAGPAEAAGSGGTAGVAGAAGTAGSGGGAAEDAGLTNEDAGGSEATPDAGPPIIIGPVDKLDLLFMIDNSRSMADKQGVLRFAIPDLVSRLTNPSCVDASGNLSPPPAAGQVCPEGQRRELTPLADIHIGIISSSLGDAGANAPCPASGFESYVPDRIDMAHLVGTLARGQSAAIPTGFLSWAPGTDAGSFNDRFDQMLAAVGQAGCGFEAQLESWYRFLVDPYPYRSLVRVPCPGAASAAPNCVQQETDQDDRIVLDEVLLQQRAAFLRPDSMLAVVMLTDENDCSLQVGSQTWVVAVNEPTRPMFRGSSLCATNPNAECCFNCQLGPPPGCSSDPICNADPATEALQNRLPASEDGDNLRCFAQRRRFGIDFLYPTQRYVNALREPALCWNALDLSVASCAAENVVANPLYARGRPRDRVFLAGLIGVPWQALASGVNASGAPLAEGQLRFQSSRELTDNGTWAVILGQSGRPWLPASAGEREVPGIAPVPPTLPQMIEATEPRTDVAPGNALNGREYSTTDPGALGPNDLEYACIFRLPNPRDCGALDPTIDECDCYTGSNDRPLCEDTPGVSSPGTVQYWGKAYPGGRHLEVLKGLGENAVVASICARNLEDDGASDFGYRPAVDALIERLREQLP
jgi:hypothetical protein